MYQVSSSTVFFFVVHAHTYIFIINVLVEVFFGVYITLTMMMFVGSQSSISLPSFMFISAAVSEIRESNRKKKKEEENEMGTCIYTFPGHIISFLLPISTH